MCVGLGMVWKEKGKSDEPELTFFSWKVFLDWRSMHVGYNGFGLIQTWMFNVSDRTLYKAGYDSSSFTHEVCTFIYV